MSFKELRILSGMTRPNFAKYFGIPYRTVQSWELYGESVEGRKCPDYLLKLMEYKLSSDEQLNRIMIALKDNRSDLMKALKEDSAEDIAFCRGYERALCFVLGMHNIGYDEAIKRTKE